MQSYYCNPKFLSALFETSNVYNSFKWSFFTVLKCFQFKINLICCLWDALMLILLEWFISLCYLWACSQQSFTKNKNNMVKLYILLAVLLVHHNIVLYHIVYLLQVPVVLKLQEVYHRIVSYAGLSCCGLFVTHQQCFRTSICNGCSLGLEERSSGGPQPS